MLLQLRDHTRQRSLMSPLSQPVPASDWSPPDVCLNTVALWLRLTAPLPAGVRGSKYKPKVEFLWGDKATDTLSLSCARLLQPLIFSAALAAAFRGGCLLNKAEAVDHFVQVKVGVLPRLHGGLFSLRPRKKKDKHGDSSGRFNLRGFYS